MAAVSMEQSQAGWDILYWSAVLIVGMVGVFVAAKFLQNRLRRSGAASAASFSLDELRRFRDAGELTLAEYEALRRKTLGLPEAPKPPGQADGIANE